MRISLHPDGLAGRIVNLGEWRAHLLGRLRRQVEADRRPGAPRAARRAARLPVRPGRAGRGAAGPGQIAVPLRLRAGERVLSFVSTTAVFGTPLDVTLAELAIESFYPADPGTADALRAAADRG